MEITCRLVKYQYDTKGNPITLDWLDSEYELTKRGVKVDYELQVIALPKISEEDVTVLKRSDKFIREDSAKFTNIHFYGITYTYSHKSDEIYSLSLTHII